MPPAPLERCRLFCIRVRQSVSESVRPENLVNTISQTNEGNFNQFWPQTYLGSCMCWLDFGVKGQRSKVKVTAGESYLRRQPVEFHLVISVSGRAATPLPRL